MLDTTAPWFAPVQKTGRKGFLPFATNLWDRFFISMVCLVAIHLLWMRFVEQPLQTILPHPVRPAGRDRHLGDLGLLHHDEG